MIRMSQVMSIAALATKFRNERNTAWNGDNARDLVTEWEDLLVRSESTMGSYLPRERVLRDAIASLENSLVRATDNIDAHTSIEVAIENLYLELADSMVGHVSADSSDTMRTFPAAAPCDESEICTADILFESILPDFVPAL